MRKLDFKLIFFILSMLTIIFNAKGSPLNENDQATGLVSNNTTNESEYQTHPYETVMGLSKKHFIPENYEPDTMSNVPNYINAPYENKDVYRQFNEIQDYIMKKLNEKSKQYPNNTLFLIQKGWMNISMGKFKKAIKDFKKSINLLPTSSAYMGLGMAYNNMGKNGLANKAYMKALSLKPEHIVKQYDGTDLSPNFNQALYRKRVLGIHDEALEELYKQAKGNPELLKSFEFLKKHDYDKALKGFNACLKQNPKSTIVLNGIGHLYSLLGLWSKADEAFLKTIEINPKSAEAYVGLGKIELKRHNYKKATLFFDKALEINPSLLSARNGKSDAANLQKLEYKQYE